MNLFGNSSQREKLQIFIIPIIVGIIASFCLFASELSEYNSYSEEYNNHSHTSGCEKLICGESEHTHSTACIDCGYSYYSSWHTHNSSCYCSQTEHAHDSSCYIKNCQYALYTSSNKYANANTSFKAPLLILVGVLAMFVANYWLTYSNNELAEKTYKKIEYDTDNFFNERSGIWIRKLKKWIILIFWFEIITCVVLGIVDSTKELTVVARELENFAFFVWAGAGTLFAFLSKNINMLILQFLNNINDIRENTEKE